MHSFRLFAALVLGVAVAFIAHAAEATVLISVDKGSQRMAVIVDGALQWVWPVSTGTAAYDTPNGQYTAFRMEEDHYSKEWDEAPMPHSIFFTRIGHAIHGTDQIKRLGQPASHGCVRLAREHAAALFALVKEHGLRDVKVVIGGVLPPPPPPPPPPAVAKRTPTPAPTMAATAVRMPLPRPVPEASQETFSELLRPAAPEPTAAVAPPKLPPMQDVTASVGPGRVPGPNESPRLTPRPMPRPLREALPPSAPEMPRQAARTYAPPAPSVSRPASVAQQPPVAAPRRGAATPRIYYDPRVEIIEETYVNGTWVRRRYYRQARPSDFYGRR